MVYILANKSMLRKASWWDNIRTGWKMQWASRLCWYLWGRGGVEQGGPVQRPWVGRPTTAVQFDRSVVSDSLPPHESQHTRPPCPSPTPGVYPNLCPLSQWCHPTISSSVIPFSFCSQSLPATFSREPEWLRAECSRNREAQYQEWPSWPW